MRRSTRAGGSSCYEMDDGFQWGLAEYPMFTTADGALVEGNIVIEDYTQRRSFPFFTPAQRREIAEFMAARWYEWAFAGEPIDAPFPEIPSRGTLEPGEIPTKKGVKGAAAKRAKKSRARS